MNKVAVSRKYSAYRTIDLVWLNQIPQHWAIERLRNLAKTQSGTTPKSQSSEYYENGTNYWVRTTDLNNGRLDSSEYKVTDLAVQTCGLKFLPIDSILIAMYGGMGTIGKNAILANVVTINQSVCAVLPNAKKFNSMYVWYYIQFFRPHWEFFANSARKDPNINQEDIKRLWVPVPPILEQKTIADYLDAQTLRIDRKIDLLNQKAQKYTELKQALIDETVIHGLDKTVPFKESGVGWIGKIPAHWEMKRLKEVTNIQNSNVDKKSDENELPVRLCNYVDVYKNDFIHSSLDFMQATADRSEIKRFSLKKNDVLITKDSEAFDDIAVPALVIETMGDVICGYHLAQIRTNEKKLLGPYLFRLFQSNKYGFRYRIYAKGFIRFGLGQSVVNDALTPIPPLSEQKEITEYLDTKTAHIERIVNTIKAEIEKLKELRKTLINDVVTGKIKVYEA